MRYRTYPFGKDVLVGFDVTVPMGCGCVYDRFITRQEPKRILRRYRTVCDDHAVMADSQQRWEMED